MYNTYNIYPCNYCDHSYDTYQCPYFFNPSIYNPYPSMNDNIDHFPLLDKMKYGLRYDSSKPLAENRLIKLKDYGPQPFVVNIDEATKQNNTFRTALWTGNHLQVTLMSINVGNDIGLEVHPDTDQFIRIEEGQGLVKMGNSKDRLDFQVKAFNDFAIFVPAGIWHNIINTGNKPLKVYSIYAPPHHPHNTVHVNKADAQAAERNYR